MGRPTGCISMCLYDGPPSKLLVRFWKESWHFGRGWVHVQDWHSLGLSNENDADGCTPFKAPETELLVHWSNHDRFNFVATKVFWI